MNNNLIIFSVIICAAAVSGWYFGGTNAVDGQQGPGQGVAVSDPAAGPGSTSTTTANTPSRSVASVKMEPKLQSPYMKNLMAEKSAQQVYARSLEIFKDLPQKEALGKWIALGLRLDSSKEFGEEFQSSLAEINQNPNEVLEAISGAYGKLGNEDSFIQSMLINVVHQLNVPKEEKVGFYTERLSDKFVLDDKGGPTASSLNITNSMAFLKQYESDPQTVKAKIESSLNEHRDNKRAQKELAERFAAYFPELQGDIQKWSDQ